MHLLQMVFRTLARSCGTVALLGLLVGPASAATVTVSASDAGFVTEAGGSAKGDATVTPGAKYNYSAGFELHYGTGALGAPLAPMMRRNYFVFDLSAVTTPVSAATLRLWTGTLETADAFEFYALHEITDMPAALALTAALAGGALVSEFDSPSDPLVMSAALLYGKLADGPTTLGALGLTTAMNDSFADTVLTPAGVGVLNSFLGAKLVLSGLVPSAVPPAFPQQPFGFTGPDIPAGDAKTPMLLMSVVPEPSMLALALQGGLALLGGLALRCRVRGRARRRRDLSDCG